MKKIAFIIPLILVTLLGCEKSASDEFDEANGNVVRKLVKNIVVVSAQNSSENKNITINYDSNYRLNTVSDGQQTSVFVYENGEISTITGQNDNLIIEDLYASPYDVYENGDVLEYDSKGNPIKLLVTEEIYNYNTGTYDVFDYTALISYDNKPNLFYYTLDSAGLIDVMDGVKLNFSANAQSPEIVMARALLPVNNPTDIVYKNQNGETVSTVAIDYVYDDDNYPSSATTTAVSIEDNDTSVYNTTITYINP